jgi:hypothetical protein
MPINEHAMKIYVSLEKFLRDEITAMELVRIVDEVMLEFDGDDDATNKILDDLHIDIALFVADPTDRKEDPSYIGPDELAKRAGIARDSLSVLIKMK